MKNLYKIRDEMFNFDVWLFIGTHAQKEAYLKKRFKVDPEPQAFFGGSSCVITCKNPPEAIQFIWLPHFDFTLAEYSTLSHECLHASIKTLHNCRIEHDYDNHEILAYLHQHYFYELLIELKKDRY